MERCKAVARCMEGVQRVCRECAEGDIAVVRCAEGVPQLNSCQLHMSQHVKLFHSLIFYHSLYQTTPLYICMLNSAPSQRMHECCAFMNHRI